ncbi:MAG: methyltransferase domain-containing protein [Acidobacteriota bacterium]
MNAPPDWWNGFFSGLMVDFWRAVVPPAHTALEADFLEAHLELAPASRVLDVPCGDGRLARALARKGHRVTAVDLSSDFLTAGRRDADREGAELTWRQSDMRDLPWSGEFAAAICAGSSFGYLGDEGDAEFVRAVARTLSPGGRFVLDASKVAESILPAFIERREIELGDMRFVSENRYDARRGRIENRYTATRGAETETRLASHRIYTTFQVCGFLESAGLEVVSLFGSADGSPYRVGAQQLYILARR